MPIKPRDFLLQARTLIDCDEEVDHRSAASRAYYCAMHTCKSLTDGAPRIPDLEEESSHEKVIRYLICWPNHPPFANLRKECVALGISLRKGRNMRVRADYKLLVDFEMEDAKQHVANMGLVSVKANHLLERLKAALAK